MHIYIYVYSTSGSSTRVRARMWQTRSLKGRTLAPPSGPSAVVHHDTFTPARPPASVRHTGCRSPCRWVCPALLWVCLTPL